MIHRLCLCNFVKHTVNIHSMRKSNIVPMYLTPFADRFPELPQPILSTLKTPDTGDVDPYHWACRPYHQHHTNNSTCQSLRTSFKYETSFHRAPQEYSQLL